MAERVSAWLLDWPGCALALPLCEVVEWVDQPEIHRLSFGPAWCRALLYWRERLIPMALTPAPLEGFATVVAAFQTAPGEALCHAALPVVSHPRRIEVFDGSDCELPESLPFATEHVRACFSVEGRAVLVPNLAALFS